MFHDFLNAARAVFYRFCRQKEPGRADCSALPRSMKKRFI